MRVLIFGDGAREHSLALSLKSAGITDVAVSPGNGGMQRDVDVIPWDASPGDAARIVRDFQPDFVLVCPTEYLVAGVSDVVKDTGVHVFAPVSSVAMLEADKIFAKRFMDRWGIPTPAYRIVHTVSELERALKYFAPPYVLKVPTLAGGKGTFVLPNLEDALRIGGTIITSGFHGLLSDGLIVEEYIPGEEYSIQVAVYGSHFVLMPPVWEYQRLLDGGRGPNTGGMGAVSPVGIDPAVVDKVLEIVDRTLFGLHRLKMRYDGFLYIGVMVSSGEVKVLEYNVRLGDPETEVIATRYDQWFAELAHNVAHGRVPEAPPSVDEVSVAVSVVCENAPWGPFRRSRVEFSGGLGEGQYLFWDDVATDGDDLVVDGWRPAVAVGVGPDYTIATRRAYDVVERVNFAGKFYRKDIASELFG